LYVAYHTSKNASNETFFIGNRKSPWFLVAYGMIGASLSGVTFISVPGWVGSSQFSYMQMVFGYLAGYLVIGTVLMPMYYRLKLMSIYKYLDTRFGNHAYKTGALFFLLSRTIGSAFRLFLSVNVLYLVLFQHLAVPYWISVLFIVLFIYLFTFKGGIRTVVFTDTIQTTFLLASLIGCIYIISSELHIGAGDFIERISNSPYSKMFFWESLSDKQHFLRQFISGAFIAIVMTGLDQDLMQKNLSCKNLKDAQKNMFWFSITLLPVNLLFLTLGALLYIFATTTGMAMPKLSDDLFPMIATMDFMPPLLTIIFILGLVSSTYSSADSALTALTTSFTLDILDASKHGELYVTKSRKIVHIGMALLLVALILVFRAVNNQSVISAVFTVAGYTYGPLLGLYSFGLFTKRKVNDRLVPYIAVAAPVLCLVIKLLSDNNLIAYKPGFELLILNGLITFTGLLIVSFLWNRKTQ
jgi:Na+/proline symporter